jgi:hypothetical protein
MRLTIVPSDGAVIIDKFGISGLDLSFMPSNVHAVQWYDTFGEVETVNEYGKPVANVPITELDANHLQAVSLWETAKAEYEARMVAANSEPKEV